MTNTTVEHRVMTVGKADAHPDEASGLLGRMRAFARDLRGNVAITFGLAIIPVSLAMGTAIDYSRAFMVQQRLAQALDSAALAVGSSIETDPDALANIAQEYFNANYGTSSYSAPGDISIQINSDVITMSASATVDTSFVKIAGINHVSVAAATEVTKETKGTEIVMVLDNTGSMGWSGKLSALQYAAEGLVDIVFGDETEPELLRVGVVPFAASVNVGSDMIDSGWIDTAGVSSYNGMNFLGGSDALSMYDGISNRSWNGCVEARPSPYDTTDAPPDPSNGDTLWVPYFAPDEPNGSYVYDYYSNSYLSDGGGGYDMDTRQRREEKYAGAYVYSSSRGPDYNCRIATLTPLTNVRSDINDAINSMVATGNTVIPIGLAWGWRLLSPTEPFTEGSAYDSDVFDKVLILLTDGQNDIGTYSNSNHNGSYYSGYGYVAQGRLGTTNGSDALDELDARTAELCENIKAEGITIYTITFQLSNGPTKDLMRNCATSSDLYFDSPDNETLQANFQTIGKQLRNLRLSR